MPVRLPNKGIFKILNSTTHPANADIEPVISSEYVRLRSFIQRRVASLEDAEDILQDVVLRLVDRDNIGEPIGQVTSWLFTVARNRITDWYRKHRHTEREYSGGPAGESGDESELPASGGEANTPELLYLRALLWEEFENALADMPAEQREVYEMHELEGKSFKDIAASTGENVNTLLSRKRYAVTFLRKRLADYYEELESD
jgi:RNA polymerase sigma factor (sigma-70 family)